MKKRILSLFLALALLLSVVPAVSAETDYQLTYEVYTDSVTYEQGVLITGYTGTLPEKLVIPETIDGYHVGGIQMDALSSAPIKEVVIPGSIKELTGASFERNQTLESVTLSEGITAVDYAFDSCPKLKEVHLPSTLERIGSRAFAATAIESIEFPAGLKYIGDYAFVNCKLKSLRFPNGLETVGKNAFQGNYAEGVLILPESITSLGRGSLRENCFSSVILLPEHLHLAENPFQINCIVYAHKAVLESNQSILNENYRIIALAIEDLPYDPATSPIAVENGIHYATADGNAYIVFCDASGELVVPDTLGGCTVKAILPAAFYNAVNLTALTLPDSIEEIGYRCFGKCTATLERLPKNLKKLGEDAFNDFMATGPSMTIKDGTIPEGVKEIPAGCFHRVKFETLVLPAGLETIGGGAFSDTGVKEVTFLGGVKSIGIGAFAGCAFKEVEIPEGLEHLGSEAFAYCENLEKVVLPRSLKQIDEFALGYNEKNKLTVYGYKDTPLLDFCQNQRIPFVDRETGELVPMIYNKEIDGVNYLVDPNKGTATVVGVYTNKIGYILEIPETVDGYPVTTIQSYALHDLCCGGLILPDSLTCIESYAISIDDTDGGLFILMPNNAVTIAADFLGVGSANFVNYCFLPEDFTLSEESRPYADNIFSGFIVIGYEKHREFIHQGFPLTVDGIPDERLMLSESGVFRLDGKEFTQIFLSIGYAIPSEINGIPVTRVAASCQIAFSTVVLGENVRVVEDGAFVSKSWVNPTTIYVPAGIEYLPADFHPTWNPCTIYGYSGTYAETYAKEHGLIFAAIDKTPFADVEENAWYFPYVHDIYWAGLMNGTSATTFEPNGTTTRAMVVQVLYNLAGEEVGYYQIFNDVNLGDWFYDAVTWAYACGVCKGTTETTFSPNDPVTREQLAAFLYRFTTLCGIDCKANGDLSKFADKNQISDYAKDAISWAVGAGIINGKSPTTVAPRAYATRAEIAAMLCRLLDYIDANLPA